jgi:hypothetical protein
MDPATRAAPDADHRLVRAGAWGLTALWAAMTAMVVERLRSDGPIVCSLDDTLFHRGGPNVDGAGSFRDAVRSTRNHVVYARDLNLVVLVVRINAPGAECPSLCPSGCACTAKAGPSCLPWSPS